MWNILKNKQMRGYDFDRQKPLLNYIVDFFCYDLMLVIEVDGITHHDDGDRAEKRQKEIENYGVNFLRFDAMRVVKNTEEVLQVIEKWIEDSEEKSS